MAKAGREDPSSGRKVRYAIVGLGWISQAAAIPGLRNAGPRSALGALVSGDREKLDTLGERYDIDRLYTYDEYDACLESGEVDAVYIGLPNHLHRDYAIRAAGRGIHVLCEKPLAATVRDCTEMIEAAAAAGVRLMTAYRLHFEPANLAAAETVRSGRLGEPRFFDALFSQQVEEGDIRLRADAGGGTLLDMGVYPINAARHLFGDEPVEALGMSASRDQPRFGEIPEMTASILRFPGERIAAFTCSFGGSEVDTMRIVGTRGDLTVEPAFNFGVERRHRLAVAGEKGERSFPAGDEFGPEFAYFSDCILEGREPEPDGREGLADVRVVEALRRSMETGEPVALEPFEVGPRPGGHMADHRPAVETPEPVEASGPEPD